jgi:hypothetical protein
MTSWVLSRTDLDSHEVVNCSNAGEDVFRVLMLSDKPWKENSFYGVVDFCPKHHELDMVVAYFMPWCSWVNLRSKCCCYFSLYGRFLIVVIWEPSEIPACFSSVLFCTLIVCRACAKCLVVFGSRLDCFNISTYLCSHCNPEHINIPWFLCSGYHDSNAVIHHEVCIVLLPLLFSGTGRLLGLRCCIHYLRNLCSVWGALYSVYRIMTATGIKVYKWIVLALFISLEFWLFWLVHEA